MVKQIKKIQNVDKELAKIMGLEALFIERLRLTISREAGLWRDLE